MYLAVEVGGADEGATRAGEGEEGKGHGDGDVDAHLTHVDLVLVLARSRTGAGEDGGTYVPRAQSCGEQSSKHTQQQQSWRLVSFASAN